ncbi:alpha/beta fold hydrolase [Candidatus Wolfebacteria bacterium]|nr:alpha/beta fold hydrolase [Candidatus Wolfebacteria bacterium]
MEKLFLTTKDGVKIAADLYDVKKPLGWLVLSHMMPATKESYKDLATKAQNEGYESIAIDLRGHGESIDAELRGTDADSRRKIIKLNYLNFSDEEHQKSILDLQVTVDYLIKERNATPDKIFFIGASIGANLSLQYINEYPEFKTAVLLSPGLNYRGLKTEPLVKNLKKGQKVFFISAKDDNNNAEQNQKLYDLTPNNINKKIKIYETGRHGTDILKNQPELINLIFYFIQI